MWSHFDFEFSQCYLPRHTRFAVPHASAVCAKQLCGIFETTYRLIAHSLHEELLFPFGHFAHKVMFHLRVQTNGTICDMTWWSILSMPSTCSTSILNLISVVNTRCGTEHASSKLNLCSKIEWFYLNWNLKRELNVQTKSKRPKPTTINLITHNFEQQCIVQSAKKVNKSCCPASKSCISRGKIFLSAAVAAFIIL